MEINTALVLRERILEVVGKTGDTGKFLPRYRIEIGIASTTIDSAVTNSDVGEPRRIVGSNRNTTRDICHPVMDAVTPLQCHKRTEASIVRKPLPALAATGVRSGTSYSGQ